MPRNAPQTGEPSLMGLVPEFEDARPARTPTPSLVAPHYRLLRLLGGGGFGRVYLAQYNGPRGFQKQVALKVLHPRPVDVGLDVGARLRDEAKLMGCLSHPAIPAVTRLTMVSGAWAVEMEHVSGLDLEYVVRQQGPLPVRAALEIAAAVADALAYAHQATGSDGRKMRLVHRDIKLGNVMVTERGHVKVLDFGIARAEFEARESRTGAMVVGTRAYLSPEALEGHATDASDVYALGVALYALLSGEQLGYAITVEERHNERMIGRLNDLLTPGQLPGTPEQQHATLNLLYTMLTWAPEDRPTAAQVRERLHALAAPLRGTALTAWAQRTIPGLLERRSAELIAGVDVTGRILLEESEPRPDAPVGAAVALHHAPLLPPPPAQEPTISVDTLDSDDSDDNVIVLLPKHRAATPAPALVPQAHLPKPAPRPGLSALVLVGAVVALGGVGLLVTLIAALAFTRL